MAIPPVPPILSVLPVLPVLPVPPAALAAATDTPSATPTAFDATGVSSPELTAVFATGFVVLGALVVLARLRR